MDSIRQETPIRTEADRRREILTLFERMKEICESSPGGPQNGESDTPEAGSSPKINGAADVKRIFFTLETYLENPTDSGQPSKEEMTHVLDELKSHCEQQAENNNSATRKIDSMHKQLQKLNAFVMSLETLIEQTNDEILIDSSWLHGLINAVGMRTRQVLAIADPKFGYDIEWKE